ncbi:hypothetical protein T10_10511 [Trichinella papuae]|uniref:Uncharacterized protein n=1 Tax=Trichinella papuae TaxID=268474 RepID=A0A0V1M3C2_9BILA|nr:hypothetical protein T10_10511 [Trichinella papuae]
MINLRVIPSSLVLHFQFWYASRVNHKIYYEYFVGQSVQNASLLKVENMTVRQKGRNELRKFQECCGMSKQIYTSTTSGKHLYEHCSLYEMSPQKYAFQKQCNELAKVNIYNDKQTMNH